MTRPEVEARIGLIVGKSKSTRYVSKRQRKKGKR